MGEAASLEEKSWLCTVSQTAVAFVSLKLSFWRRMVNTNCTWMGSTVPLEVLANPEMRRLLLVVVVEGGSLEP